MALMIRASVWQWDRHNQKQAYIQQMETRMQEAIAPLDEILSKSEPNWSSLPYRRVAVNGVYDFEHEVVLRNRMYDEKIAGVHVVTPLKIDGSHSYILVNRGFIPLEEAQRSKRKIFQRSSNAHFIGLIKESAYRRFLAPKDDDAGAALPWVDSWLRVDIDSMSKQLPFKPLPIYLEIMSDTNPKAAEKEIVKASNGREELLVLGLKGVMDGTKTSRPISDFPIPAYDPVIPAGRHLGYVYEWATMALMTFLIAIILQLRPRQRISA